ncbi:unnamed protein product [Cuscuta europaea]|uniref:Uncharacterized protein n=1 Tax=Cuscuta europaea TaxID=41803 RepID=A0A9P0ZQ40_CUSEU|nr:unnamed protein product [Cuscuta europaea]
MDLGNEEMLHRGIFRYENGDESGNEQEDDADEHEGGGEQSQPPPEFSTHQGFSFNLINHHCIVILISTPHTRMIWFPHFWIRHFTMETQRGLGTLAVETEQSRARNVHVVLNLLLYVLSIY